MTPSLTLVVELTPTRHRTIATSFYIVFASAGGFLAPVIATALLGPLGWRGVAMLGVIPAIIAVLVWLFTPESVRWLAAKGRFAEARAEVATAAWAAARSRCRCRPSRRPRCRAAICSTCCRSPRMFWETMMIWGGSSTAAYGVYLWGPTIVALLLRYPVPAGGQVFRLRRRPPA